MTRQLWPLWFCVLALLALALNLAWPLAAGAVGLNSPMALYLIPLAIWAVGIVVLGRELRAREQLIATLLYFAVFLVLGWTLMWLSSVLAALAGSGPAR